MAKQIKFTDIGKIKELRVGFKTGEVEIKTKDGTPVVFFLKEIEPDSYFKLKGFSSMAKRAADKKTELDLSNNFRVGLEMTAACLTDENFNILDDKTGEVLKFLNDSFSVEQLSSLIEKMMGLCGFSKAAVKTLEKN